MLMWIFKILENVSFYLSRSCVKSELTTPIIKEVRMTFKKFNLFFLCTYGKNR